MFAKPRQCGEQIEVCGKGSVSAGRGQCLWGRTVDTVRARYLCQRCVATRKVWFRYCAAPALPDLCKCCCRGQCGIRPGAGCLAALLAALVCAPPQGTALDKDNRASLSPHCCQRICCFCPRPARRSSHVPVWITTTGSIARTGILERLQHSGDTPASTSQPSA